MPPKRPRKNHPSWIKPPTTRASELGAQLWHIPHIRLKVLSDMDGNRQYDWAAPDKHKDSKAETTKPSPLMKHLSWDQASFVSVSRVLWSAIKYEHYVKVKREADKETITTEEGTAAPSPPLRSPKTVAGRLEVYCTSVKRLFLTGAFPLLHDVGGVEELLETFPNVDRISWNHHTVSGQAYSASLNVHPHIPHGYVLSNMYVVNLSKSGELPDIENYGMHYLPASWTVVELHHLHVAATTQVRRQRLDWLLRTAGTYDNDEHGGLPPVLRHNYDSIYLHHSHSMETWMWILRKRTILDLPPLTELYLQGHWLSLDDLQRLGELCGQTLHTLFCQVREIQVPHKTAGVSAADLQLENTDIWNFDWGVLPALHVLSLTVDCPLREDAKHFIIDEEDDELWFDEDFGLGIDPRLSNSDDDDAASDAGSDSTLSVNDALMGAIPELIVLQLNFHVTFPLASLACPPAQYLQACVPDPRKPAEFLLQFPHKIDVSIKIITPKGCLANSGLGDVGHALSFAYMASILGEIDRMDHLASIFAGLFVEVNAAAVAGGAAGAGAGGAAGAGTGSPWFLNLASFGVGAAPGAAPGAAIAAATAIATATATANANTVAAAGGDTAATPAATTATTATGLANAGATNTNTTPPAPGAPTAGATPGAAPTAAGPGPGATNAAMDAAFAQFTQSIPLVLPWMFLGGGSQLVGGAAGGATAAAGASATAGVGATGVGVGAAPGATGTATAGATPAPAPANPHMSFTVPISLVSLSVLGPLGAAPFATTADAAGTAAPGTAAPGTAATAPPAAEGDAATAPTGATSADAGAATPDGVFNVDVD